MTASTPEEGIDKYRTSKDLFAHIGMNLRDFINSQINEADRVPYESMKLLGVNYDLYLTRSHFFKQIAKRSQVLKETYHASIILFMIP